MSRLSFAHLAPLATLVAVAALALAGASPAQAASFTVNATHDAVDASPGDGVCADAGGGCTLRAAVMETNALAGADEISLPAGTYALSIPGADEDASAMGDLDVTDALTITGAGRDITVVDGGGLDRVIHILPMAAGTFLDLSILNGSALVGAGLSNEGSLVLTASIVRSNFARDAGPCPGVCAAPSGGGISNLGTVQMADVLVIDNHGSVGGGIVNFSPGSMSITRSQIQVNTALSEGAAVSNFGVLDLTDSSLDHNLGGSTGGAVDNNSGELTARASIFADNRSDYGGGLYNQSVALLTNVTVSGNLARISGGGVLNVGATHSITATNLTIANNDAPVGAGIYNGSVDGIGEAGLVSLVNTIVALNGSGGDCSGPITSLGNNIDYDGTCNVDGSNIDPLIAPLADNGGSTQTHALIQGGCPSDACIVPSPAIDAGDAAACPGTDQRGEPRPFDGDGDGTGECDIGAYEVQEPPLTCTGPCGPIPTSSPTTPASPTPAPTSTPTLPFSLPATGGNAGSPAAIPFALAAAAVAGVGAAVWRVLRPTRH